MDLVSGADTKANPQIDNSFQEMINVSFDGDMTAKKMKGYEQLDVLPAGEKYSLLARRQQDLIAQTDKGVYKYLPAFSKFKKISGMGSCVVQSNETPGFAFDFSPNFKCSVEYLRGYNNYYFYTQEGVALNRISRSDVNSNESIKRRFTKVIHLNDVFYICFGVADITPTYSYVIEKFVFNPATFEFESAGVVVQNLSTDIFTSLDFFVDSTRIYAFYSTSAIKKYDSYDLNLATPLSVNMVTIPNRNIEIYQATDPLYLWVMVSVATGVNTATLKLVKLRKVDLVEVLVTDIVSRLATGGVGSYFFPIFASHPTSDTTAVYFSSTSFQLLTIPGTMQNYPVGKIFLSNGRYYIPLLVNCGNTICTVVMSLSLEDSGWVAKDPMAVTDSGQIPYGVSLPLYQFQYPTFTYNAPCEVNGTFYFPSLNPAKKAVMVSFNSDAMETNSYIEIGKKILTSGGLLGYFDGLEFTEHAFIGNPNPYRFEVGTGASLPADTGYAFVAIYRSEDAEGNTFYSAPSQIYSGGDPVNGLTLLANAKVSISVQQSIITAKNNFTLEIYIKRKNKLFQLCYSLDLSTGGTAWAYSDGTRGFIVDITTYPSATAKIYPYQDGSVAPETTSNSKSISLYTDRIFRISDDNPNSLAYSQRKLAGLGFEFNDSFLYLDVLDKRGIAEDALSTTIAMDGRLIIFKETSILYIVGSGPSRANTQDDFSEPQLIASDVGCIEPRSVVLVPDGIMFKSDKGIYILNRKLQTGYIGSSVEKFNDYLIVSAVLLENANEVRFATLNGLILVYNYLSTAWSWFLDFECVSACLYEGKYAVLKLNGQVLIENPNQNKIIDQLIVQTIASPWLRLNKIQGYQKAYYVRVLGVYKSLHKLKMNVYYDYELYSSEEYIIDPLAENQYNIEVKPTNEEIENGDAINGVYQMKIDLIRKNCQAVRIVIQDIPLDTENNTGECFALSNITVNIGLKKGLSKIQASKSY